MKLPLDQGVGVTQRIKWSVFKERNQSQVLWHMSVIIAQERLRQKDHDQTELDKETLSERTGRILNLFFGFYEGKTVQVGSEHMHQQHIHYQNVR